MEELTVTRAEFEAGYLTWYGAVCEHRAYKLIRELPDGRVVARGRPSQEPVCDIERRTVELMRQDRERGDYSSGTGSRRVTRRSRK